MAHTRETMTTSPMVRLGTFTPPQRKNSNNDNVSPKTIITVGVSWAYLYDSQFKFDSSEESRRVKTEKL